MENRGLDVITESKTENSVQIYVKALKESTNMDMMYLVINSFIISGLEELYNKDNKMNEKEE